MALQNTWCLATMKSSPKGQKESQSRKNKKTKEHHWTLWQHQAAKYRCNYGLQKDEKKKYLKS